VREIEISAAAVAMFTQRETVDDAFFDWRVVTTL